MVLLDVFSIEASSEVLFIKVDRPNKRSIPCRVRQICTVCRYTYSYLHTHMYKLYDIHMYVYGVWSI